jgi:hypothetical protein
LNHPHRRPFPAIGGSASSISLHFIFQPDNFTFSRRSSQLTNGESAATPAGFSQKSLERCLTIAVRSKEVRFAVKRAITD